MSIRQRLLVYLSVIAAPLLLVAAILIAMSTPAAEASSHREAPLISRDAFADNTDTYVWIPSGQTDRLVLAASWIPFEGPEGGPNYWEWDDQVLYSIYVDNDGDARADITYTLSSRTTVVNPETFLYNTGPIKSLNDSHWNRRQNITVVEMRAGGEQTVLVDDRPTAPVNIGAKSTPDWPSLREGATYSYMMGEEEILVYAGQTDDPFFVDLQVFDLLTLRGQQPPVGYENGKNVPQDSVSGYNVHSLLIEVPIAHVTQGEEPVIGVWAASHRRSVDVMPESGLGEGEYRQVSRLGMPLVNEVVLPLALKDTFNTLQPSQDLSVYNLLQQYVENPLVGRLLCGLYGVPLPEDSDSDCNTEYDENTPASGRGDIFQIFVTGMVLADEFTIQTADGPVTLPAGFNVNQPAGVQPAEMIRINTAISGDLCHPDGPQPLGLLAGDACGFPNGRRPSDDVTDIELLAVAGAAYQVLDGEDESFAFNPELIPLLSDNVDENDRSFNGSFPYFADAQSGQEHCHENPAMMDCSGPATALSLGGVTAMSSQVPWLYAVVGLISAGLVGAYELIRRRMRA